MRKYVLYENTTEVKKVYEGCTVDERDIEPTEIKTFDSKDEALEELKKYDSSVRDYGRYYLVEEYYVEEQERDENGEVIEDGFGIWGYSKLPDKYAEFYINEKSESGYSYKKYTFDEVKEFFKLEEDEDVSDDEYREITRENNKIEDCTDIDELIAVLTERQCGMEFTYIIEKC